jgi:hypothetical protein
MSRYLNLSREEALSAPIPILFISFPSLKDPLWTSHPGREGKIPFLFIVFLSFQK